MGAPVLLLAAPRVLACISCVTAYKYTCSKLSYLEAGAAAATTETAQQHHASASIHQY